MGVHTLFRQREARGPAPASPAEERDALVTRFTRCRVLRDGELRSEDLWVRAGKVIDPQELFYGGSRVGALADRVIDCGGMILAPGFIDLQLNGAFGHDFAEPAEIAEAVRVVAKGLLSHGCTAFLATLITSPPANYRQILPHLVPKAGSAEGAAVLGVHLEGPFISPDKPGCHPAKCIVAPDGEPDMLRRTCGLHTAHVRLVTLAPELPHAAQLIRDLRSEGVVVSAGHSMASHEDMGCALRDGVRMCTHLFNAMPGFDHRSGVHSAVGNSDTPLAGQHWAPGVIGVLGSAKQQPFFGLIADGLHVHPASLKIAGKARPDGVVLVTDAMAALGVADGIHTFGSLTVDVRDGRAVLAGTDTLAGAVVSMDECVRRFRRYCDVSTAAALQAAALHPAQVLGIEATKGTLNVGGDADLVLLDDDLVVHHTYIAGELVWSKDAVVV